MNRKQTAPRMPAIPSTQRIAVFLLPVAGVKFFYGWGLFLPGLSAIMITGKYLVRGGGTMADEQSAFDSAKSKVGDFYAQAKVKTAEAGKVAKRKTDDAIIASRDAVHKAVGAVKGASQTARKKVTESDRVQSAVESVTEASATVKEKAAEAGAAVKGKIADTRVFKSLDSLKPVVNVVNEANVAVQDASRTIANSAISDVLAGALGAVAGGAISFAALVGLGSTAASGAALAGGAMILHGLASAGAIVGGGALAGIFVLAAPVAGLAVAGVGTVAAIKRRQLKQEKERLLKAAVEKHHAVVTALKEEVDATKERTDYLNSLNILLQHAIKDLRADLKIEDEVIDEAEDGAEDGTEEQ